MNKKFLLAYLLFAAGTVLSANGDGANETLWHTEAALGITVPLKQIYVGQKESKGFSVQLEGLYRARMDNGLSLFAGAAAGPFISEGFKVNDSHSICVNVNFWGGAGYDFLKKSQKQSLVLSGLLGFDAFTFTDYEHKGGYRYRNDNTAFCFELGAELMHTIQITNRLCFYSGCSFFAGLGWTISEATREKTFMESERRESKARDSCRLLSLQPKIGLMYKIN